MSQLLAVVLVLLAALLVPPAGANTLSAPDTVYADEGGNFSYTFTVTIDPDTVVIAGLGWDNGVNVSGGMHGDCFCFPNCEVAPETVLTWDVQGCVSSTPMAQIGLLN